MGLAASQARFLGLTARKSNVEYQGQQINQQRVALSNEVMGLYEDYNRLDVPTPPSVADYTKTTYTLDSTSEGYSIESFSKITDGSEYDGYYDVVLSYQQEVAKAYTYQAKDCVTTAQKDGNGSYNYLNFQIGTNTYTYDVNDLDNSNITKISSDYEKYQGLSTIMKSQGLSEGTFYMYMVNGTAYYTSEDDLNSTAFEDVDGKLRYYGDYTFDYQGAQKTSQNVQAKAALTQDSSGRLSAIQIISCDDAPELMNNTYSITTGTTEDNTAYTDAMNQYYYEKAMYEKEVEEINKKTEKIQTEDKSLELKLNQLDTEQKAISTEMESISKVIEDTINSVFKTFNS